MVKNIATRVSFHCLEGLSSLSQCELFQLPASFPIIKSADRIQHLKQAILLKNGGQKREVEGQKLDTSPVVEFVLKLHPEIKCSGNQGHFNEGIINNEQGEDK